MANSRLSTEPSEASRHRAASDAGRSGGQSSRAAIAVAGSPRQQAQLQAVRAWHRGTAATGGKGAVANGPLTTQLFRHKPSGKKMTDLGEPVEDSHFPEVLRRLNAGEIVAESPQELDEFLGRVFGRFYDGFPTAEAVEEAFRTHATSGSSSESSVVSQNQGDVFSFVFEDQKFFAKKTVEQGGGNEAFVPYLAMRLGLGAHANPTVWYQVGDDHFAVTRWVQGHSAKDTTIAEGVQKLPDERLIELFVFDYLVASFDRTTTNVFLTEDGRVTLIDNEGSLGMTGRREPTKGLPTGAARVGMKSAFLYAFMQRHGLKASTAFPPPRFKKSVPEKLLAAPVPLQIVKTVVTIADEICTVLDLLGMKAQVPALRTGILHLSQLAQRGQFTVGDLLY